MLDSLTSRLRRILGREEPDVHFMTESSVGANPDSMLMFDDVTDVNRPTQRTRTNRSFSQSEREKLLRTGSLNMPRANKISTLASSHFGTPKRKDQSSFDSNVELVNVSGVSSPVSTPVIPSNGSTSIDAPPMPREILPESPESPNETHIPRLMRFDSIEQVPGRIENGDLPTKAADVKTPRSQYFRDGKRLVDYVLAYEEDDDDDDGSEWDDDSQSTNLSLPNNKKPSLTLAEMGAMRNVLQTAQQLSMEKKTRKVKKAEKRAIFESNLKRLGLELEYASARHSRTKFVLIHAPFHVLTKQAELMRIKMPVHQNDIKKNATLMDGLLNNFLKRFKFLEFNDEMQKRTEMQDYFTQPFMEEHLDCFVNHDDEENFFPRTERSRMVYDFLIRTRYDKGKSTKFRVGIQRLLYNRTYTAAYPLHEEIDYYPSKPIDLDTCSDRQFLYETWVRMKNFYKYQPLHLIQKYFGTQVGFYFSWLGYYTRFLYIISIIGILCTAYGFITLTTDYPSKEICQDRSVGAQIVMCPVCDHYCDFTYLNESCTYSKITYVFDNYATIFFAGLMSIWATLFLEGWKRYHAEIAYKWNVFDQESEGEIMRPEFQFKVKKKRKNPVTQETEPYVPLSQKLLRFIGSGATVLFFVCLVVALAIGIIVYRIIIRSVFYDSDNSESKWLQSNVIILTSMTAASINLVFILIMNYFYNWLALKLTDWECPRTQTEFDNSYTLKVFLFQFVNYYSSLFYIAFFKGRFVGVPGPSDHHEITIKGQRLEQCDPAGCMVELVIQLFIIMVGKQFFNAFMEIGYPICYGFFRRWQLKLPETKAQQRERLRRERLDAISINPEGVAQYEKDYALNPVGQQFLFDEYLEMVIQFGFVTLFVAAFPLAPFFALVNNIFEIRLDAYKFIVTTQRPMPAQARGIGIWITILDIMSKLAVLCNAFVIAFTSDFIPKMYYLFTRGTVLGFVEFSLSYYDARNLTFSQNRAHMENVDVCRYRDFRKVPCSLGNLVGYPKMHDCDDNYDYAIEFWIILALRLVFVVVFEHLVLSIKAIFAYIIPDVPTKIVIQLQREKYLARQAVLQRQGIILTSRADGNAKDDTDMGKDEESQSEDEAAVEPGKMDDGDDPVPSRQLSQVITGSKSKLNFDDPPKTAPVTANPRFRPKSNNNRSEPNDLAKMRKSAPAPVFLGHERLSDSVESFQTAPPNFESDNDRKSSDIWLDRRNL